MKNISKIMNLFFFISYGITITNVAYIKKWNITLHIWIIYTYIYLFAIGDIFPRALPASSLIYPSEDMHLHPCGVVERIDLSFRRSSWRTNKGLWLVYILSSVKRFNVRGGSRKERSEREWEKERQRVKEQVIGRRFVNPRNGFYPPYSEHGPTSFFPRERFEGENSTFARFFNLFWNSLYYIGLPRMDFFSCFIRIL